MTATVSVLLLSFCHRSNYLPTRCSYSALITDHPNPRRSYVPLRPRLWQLPVQGGWLRLQQWKLHLPTRSVRQQFQVLQLSCDVLTVGLAYTNPFFFPGFFFFIAPSCNLRTSGLQLLNFKSRCNIIDHKIVFWNDYKFVVPVVPYSRENHFLFWGRESFLLIVISWCPSPSPSKYLYSGKKKKRKNPVTHGGIS